MANDSSNLNDKVNELLQEVRIVLPGTQALLGFQFVAFFNPVFQNLSLNLKYFHFGTLLLTTLATLLLMAPVAFQQVHEEGDTTHRFIRFTAKMLGASMLLLLLSLAGETYLAARLINPENHTIGVVAAVFILVFGGIVWFGYSSLKKSLRQN